MVGKATTGASFSGLSRYLTGDAERVAWTEARWMLGTDPKEVAREMEATAGQSSRVQKPVYHLSLSFDPADQPTREQMQQAVDRVLHELGLDEHQAFLVAHRDKVHPHVHVMVNRVHPETGRAWSTSRDYARIEQALRGIEREWGWKQVAGHHAREQGAPAPDRTQSSTTGEIRRTRRTGEKPFVAEVRERLGGWWRVATNWREFSDTLDRRGLRFEARGRGLVITDGERFAKASGVHRDLSRFRLEERFGQKLVAHLGQKDVGDLPERSVGQGGDSSGALRRVIGEAYSVKRLQEEPEREEVRRAAQGVVSAAELLAHDPEVRKAYEAVQAVEELRGKEATLREVVRAYQATENKLNRIPELEQRVERFSESFDRELARVYQKPQAARQAFEAMAGREGTPSVVDALRNQPGRFGDLVVERRSWLGMARTSKDGLVPRAARTAAEYGRQYFESRAVLPSRPERDSLRDELARQRSEVERLKGEVRLQPRAGELRDRLKMQVRKLKPEQYRALQKVIGAEKQKLLARAVSSVKVSLRDR